MLSMSSGEFLLPNRFTVSSGDHGFVFSWAVRTCDSRTAFLVGIKSTVLETQRADHAKEIVTGLSLSELQSFDGFVAVRS